MRLSRRRSSSSTQSKLRRRLLKATPICVAEPLEARRLLSTAPPTLVGISRATPAAETTDAATVYAVAFNEPVTGVTAADFQLAGANGPAASALMVSPATGYQSIYVVTVSNVAGKGASGLSLVNTAGIVDAGGIHMASNTLSFSGPSSYPDGAWNAYGYGVSVAVGDFNGDGIQDLAVTGFSGVDVLMGNPDGTFQAPVGYYAGWYPTSVAVADLTGNGKEDLVVGTFGVNGVAGGVSVLLGNGDGTFQSALFGSDNYWFAGWSVTVGDFNHDGIPDLAVATGGASVEVMLGNGDGTFGWPIYNPVDAHNANSVVVGDFNHDGNADLAVATDIGVDILLGNGDGRFQEELTFAAGNSPSGVAVGDFNADGKADLAVANSGGDISVLLNTSAGATPSWLGAGSAASWNASTQTLTVTGNATITANPATFSNTPIIDANTGSHLVLNTPSATIGGLALQSGATVDIASNALFINYGNGSSPLAAVQAGVGNGSIISSTANAGPTGQYTVGFADSTETSIVPSGNVELMYTLSADAELKGTVNFRDYSIMQNNYNQTGRDWAQGDWNHDGTVNFLDYSLLQNNYNQSVPAALAGAATATLLPQTSYTAATALPLSPDNQNQLDTDAAIDGWSQQGVIGYVL